MENFALLMSYAMSHAMKPILVTGAHRSGSTWVGRMLASAPQVGYIQEPLNLYHRPGICGAQVKHWFPYISCENEALYYENIRDTINFRYKVGKELQSVRSLKDLLRAARDYRDFSRYQATQSRPLIKDPLAIFSAEWLASKFEMDVVMLIRHPAAFVASIKSKKWAFPFSHILEQTHLIEAHLHPFAAEIQAYTEVEQDLVDQACLLWKLIHFRISQYQNHHKDWIFKRHEDISLNPLSEFKDICERLNLEFSEAARHTITSHSATKNPVDALKYDPFLFLRRHLKRDSKANIFNWKSRLNHSEIARIKEQTHAISSLFYTESDWT
ncbi:MAG: sulfotransferase [Leptolyngbyaceae cyanobacterium]